MKPHTLPVQGNCCLLKTYEMAAISQALVPRPISSTPSGWLSTVIPHWQMLKQMEACDFPNHSVGKWQSQDSNPDLIDSQVYFPATKSSRVFLQRSVSLNPEIRKMSPDRLPWGGVGTRGEEQRTRRLSDKRSLPRRPCREELLVVKLSISALGANLLSGKLSDSIGLLSLSKINLSESGVRGNRGGDESFAVLIRFSELCQV